MGNLNFKIKVVYDFDECEYICFIEGIDDLEGRGTTELEAIKEFKLLYDIRMTQ